MSSYLQCHIVLSLTDLLYKYVTVELQRYKEAEGEGDSAEDGYRPQ